MPYRVIKSIDGRRGSVLLTLSLIFLALATSQVFHRPTGRDIALAYLPDWITPALMGIVSYACSIIGLTVALASKKIKSKWLHGAFGLVMIPPSMMALFYFGAFLLGTSPSAYLSFAIYGGFAWLILQISNWDEPRSTPPLTNEQRMILEGDAP